MEKDLRGLLLGSAVVFIVIFGGMTLIALGSASFNFASVISFGLAFGVIGIALAGLLGAIRNPPDEDD